MNRKGFTLVELLAVIVILGALSIIIIPRINDAIESSRKNSAVVSANEYSKAITQYFLNNESDFSKTSVDMTGSYSVDNGTISRNDYNYKISINGDAPKSGKVNLKNGEVVSGCLLIDKYSVIISDSTVISLNKGNCPKMLPDHIDDDIIYFAPEDIKANPLYFNVDTAEYCTLSDYNSSMSAAAATESKLYPKSGCLKWYAYSENPDGTINMILAHNTTKEVAWVNAGDDFPDNIEGSDYLDGASVGITYDYSLTDDPHYNISGPVTALKQLKSDTNSWSSNLVRSDSYKPSLGSYRYNINYSSYKARLISAEEISSIVDKDFMNGRSDDKKFIDSYSGTSPYSWLYDYTNGCLQYGCSVEANSYNETSGFWTSTYGGYDDSLRYPETALDVWRVRYQGDMSFIWAGNPSGAGIRPVITFSKPENF